MTYALDTNTLSYIIRGEGEVDKRFEQEIIEAGNSYAIAPVAIYELQRWLMDNPTHEMELLAQELDLLYQNVRSKAEMSAASWEKAAEIYVKLKQGGNLIEEADIFIAAYCLVNQYVLVTNNLRHFTRIEGLNCVNWKV